MLLPLLLLSASCAVWRARRQQQLARTRSAAGVLLLLMLDFEANEKARRSAFSSEWRRLAVVSLELV